MSRVANRDPEADGPRTSGMVALMPTAADAQRLAVDGGEDPDQLHLTLAYLGDNATGLPPETQQALHQVMGHLAAETPPVDARAAGHLLLNPDGGPDGDRTPVAAYLMSDSDALTPLHEAAKAAAGAADPALTQFSPFIPHVSGAYDRDAGALGYAGPVSFDRMRVAIGDGHTDYPLTGPASGGTDPDADGDIDDGTGVNTDDDPTVGDDGARSDKPEGKSVISLAELVELAELTNLVSETKGDAPDGGNSDAPPHSMPDGSYQINHPGQLKQAINALTAYQVAKGKRGALRKHVMKHAARLHAQNMVPQSIQDEGDDDPDAKKDAAPEPVETKNVVATQAGVARYGKPIGTVLGAPRDAAAAQAQKDTGAVTAYQDLLAGNTRSVEPLNTMDPSSLEALTRVAYSYKSSDPKVVALRVQLANELAKRGLKVTSFGALGGGGPTKPARGKAPVKPKAPAKPAPTPAQVAGARGVAAPHVQAKGDLDVTEVEYKTKYTADDRRTMAKKGQALPDGCLSGDTLVATRNGSVRIDALPSECELLTDHGWTQATVCGFGVQKLRAVELFDGVRTEIVHATSGHRWLIDGGDWRLTDDLIVGDRIPHVDVSSNDFNADLVNTAHQRIARKAKQTPHHSSAMVVINLEAGPCTTGTSVGTIDLRDAMTDSTQAALTGKKCVELRLSNAVLAPQHSISATHPALIGNIHPFSAGACSVLAAETAVGSPTLIADIEIGMRSFGAAGAAGDKTDIADWYTLGVNGHGHPTNATRSWEVVGIKATRRIEEVFCALVPDLHRFVLASGVLTGNSYPIMDRSDLDSAIRLRGRHSEYSADTVVKHIVKRAKAIDATDMLPDGMAAGVQEKQLSWDGAPDAFTAGVLLGLSGLDTDEALELKAGPPGHTFASPDPNAARLRRYWVFGKGRAKINWGVPGDFDRCVAELTKYVGDRAKGLCNIYHRSALGVAPGQEDKPGHAVAKAVGAMVGAKKSEDDETETKALTALWVRDPAAVDGWRAYAPAWPLDDDLIAEMKALRPNKPSGGYVGADDEEDSPDGNAPDDTNNTDSGTDDDVLSALDNYAAMAPQISPEDAYMQAIGDQIPWQLAATGDLVNPDSPGGEVPVLQREEARFGEAGPSDAAVDDLSGTDEVPDADDAGADDDPTFPDDGDLSFDPDDTNETDDGTDGPDDGAGDTGDGSNESDTGAAIPEVAELLADLMAEQDTVAAPTDDDDAGEPEEDSTAITTAPKRQAAASVTA
jgi:hypothetical protein